MYRNIIFSVLSLSFFLFSLILPQHTLAMPNTVSANSPTLTGTVIETMNAASYTYMLIESNTGQKWIAIPETSVKAGSTVNYVDGMVMKNFKSNTLNRTFDSIVFSPGLADATGKTTKKTETNNSFAAAVKAEKQMAPSSPPMETSGGSAVAIVPFEEIAIEKSSAENGYSVEEIFKQAKALNGKTIQIHAKVVKFSPNIMGRNWVHLQDGTGNPMQNTHDLVVTTPETVELHSTVTLEGVLTAKKDFGAGYKYDAIIENASLVK